jgi:hypothetical protein
MPPHLRNLLDLEQVSGTARSGLKETGRGSTSRAREVRG